MSTDYTTYYHPAPDVIKVAIDWMKTHPYLTGTRVAGDLKGYDNSGVWIVVTQTGSQNVVKNVLWKFNVDINVYADTRAEASEWCSQAQAALMGAKNHVFSTGVVTCVDEGTVQDLTDPVNSNYRFVSDVDITFERR